ncbi:hypothetical protein EJ03DRAFT_322764 [Teratosphaeria nubilosa]|uniref:Uncharacterized protein n=1 Tax=Teratosphaeria nubilosa TaxID=161662 RepID=A0A6G1LMK6_9PEZI|nr:hypothetical protein EJ03DRAFT_322764 [Teratosphaeria nubilosa]
MLNGTASSSLLNGTSPSMSRMPVETFTFYNGSMAETGSVTPTYTGPYISTEYVTATSVSTFVRMIRGGA